MQKGKEKWFDAVAHCLKDRNDHKQQRIDGNRDTKHPYSARMLYSV